MAGSCDASDFQSPIPAAMPLARRLATTETFPVATVTLNPPAPQDEPSVPPEIAWDAANVQKRVDTRYEVILARMSAEFPATMGVGLATNPLYQTSWSGSSSPTESRWPISGEAHLHPAR